MRYINQIRGTATCYELTFLRAIIFVRLVLISPLLPYPL